MAGRTEQVWDSRLPGTIGDTVAQIEAAGGRAVAVRADLTDRDDVAALVTAARDSLGPITILVNNAAFTAPGRPPVPGAAPGAKSSRAAVGKPGWPGFVSVPLAAYRRHFETSVFAAYELMQLSCPDMIAAGPARSSTSLRWHPGYPATGPILTAAAASCPDTAAPKPRSNT
ncbi:short chain dehydrogenase family protein [Mycobacterium ulcerans str. Harvey]|uniref:Short chain dehydrogenase family protein n=1 Tax=Mycobacterium ulcerans str. Harvey TaxID=1299332 RepID=A0ABP3AGQ2_MYCUL|nr:short chain dehydrogenase family protein [Mycobacterium ulcerans str. Harvey]